jgi:hypothetical protein
LRQHLESGGAALFLAVDRAAGQAIASFLPGVQIAAVEPPRPASGNTSSKDQAAFVLFSEIDFTSPVFAAFAEPRFGDFSKVRFWNHQRFELQPEANARVLARFDDGSPALWEQPVGNGRALVFASTWRPADSQLALSSKFVPLLSSVLNQAAGIEREPAQHLVVGDPMDIPPTNEPVKVRTPAGVETALPAGERKFVETSEPGIYELHLPQEKSSTLAVNLPSAESDTAPLPADRLEQLGVRIGELPNRAQLEERERQLRDIELESRQKLWQWLVVVVIAVLGVETVLAGRATRQQETSLNSKN